MAKLHETRIVITRGTRADLKAELDVYEPACGRLKRLAIPCGPRQSDIDREVYSLKQKLEAVGNWVTVIERHAREKDPFA